MLDSSAPASVSSSAALSSHSVSQSVLSSQSVLPSHSVALSQSALSVQTSPRERRSGFALDAQQLSSFSAFGALNSAAVFGGFEGHGPTAASPSTGAAAVDGPVAHGGGGTAAAASVSRTEQPPIR